MENNISSEKQKLARARNWFKFYLTGMVKPVPPFCLSDYEKEKLSQIIELRNDMLNNFNNTSIEFGLKVKKD